MSVITKMMEFLFPKVESKVLLLGLDASGRTSWLHRLKHGELVTTIPTIGFNVQTVTHKQHNFTFWDIGGCDKIRPLWRHYFQGTDGCMFFVDCNDTGQFAEIKNVFDILITDEALKNCCWVIYGNKQDLRPTSEEELYEIFDLKRYEKTNQVLVVTGNFSDDHSGTNKALDFIVDSRLNQKQNLDSEKKEKSKEKDQSTTTKQNNQQESKNEDILIEWLERKDDDDDLFLSKLDNYTLESWDHYTHLRIAWLFLTKYGRKQGLPLIFDKIRLFIQNSPRTKRSRGTTFHETMTYFWAHMVHYAIEVTKNPNATFKGFLFVNPQFSNGGMFLHFYTKELMLNNPQSRNQVVLPDKRPLPSLITNVDKAQTTILIPKVSPKQESDEEFMDNFEKGKFKSWGHESMLRVIWVVLKKEERKKGVSILFELFKNFEKDSFHMTITYFWIQMVDLVRAKLNQEKKQDIQTFEQFINTQPAKTYLSDSQSFMNFYTMPLISSENAKTSFVIPDKQPLPNVLK